MFEQVILLSAALVGMGDGKVELPLSSAMQRIDACLASYLQEHHLPQAVEPCEPIIQNEEVLGFKIDLGSDEYRFDLDGYLLEEYQDVTYYSSSVAGMTDFSSLMGMSGFDPLSCVCQIPSLVSQFGSSAFGNWNALSFEADTDDCAQIASLDLIYTYQFSGMGNPTSYTNSNDLYLALQTAQNYQSGLGILLADYLPGLNAVLKPFFHATSGSYDGTKPVVCAYSPATGNVGHFAMKIGEAETSAFWNIKTQWDIVVSLEPNYLGAEPVSIDHNEESCFFGIQANRRQATFLLFGC